MRMTLSNASTMLDRGWCTVVMTVQPFRAIALNASMTLSAWKASRPLVGSSGGCLLLVANSPMMGRGGVAGGGAAKFFLQYSGRKGLPEGPRGLQGVHLVCLGLLGHIH